LFAVQAMDEAGAVTPVFDLDHNLRRILVGTDGWPILSVYNRYIGTTRTTVLQTPPVIIDLPAGLGIVFEWSGNAEHYGGIIVGYRYAWDILDLNDDDQWGPWTPFVGEKAQSEPRSFYYGTHTFHVEIIDNSGFKARYEAKINIVPFSMERDLLLVDDWAWEGDDCFADNSGVVPCDAEHDQFWLDMLETAAGFNPLVDVVDIGDNGQNTLPIPLLGRYKNVIWNATGDASGRSAAYLDELITFINPETPAPTGKITPNLVAVYMAVGGHVLLCGNQIMTLVIDAPPWGFSVQYPIIFRYELGGDQDGIYGGQDVGVRGIGEDSFAYGECCLNVLDQSFLQNPNQIRGAGGRDPRCPVTHLRDHDRIGDGMRSALPIDVTTGGGFPQLDLRPEVSGPRKFFETAGLIVDIYNPEYFTDLTPCGVLAETQPPRSCFEPIYGNGCSNTASLIYDAPVAFWTSQFVDRVPDVAGGVAARSAVWGFHPVYFNPDQVSEALAVILHDEWQLPRNWPASD
jgi:hypothetical protein